MGEKRKFQRVPFQCECQISCGDRSWTGELYDLSLRGALFRLPKSAELKDRTICFLDILLGDSEIRLQFEVELVHREGALHGFRFLSENLDTLIHLRRLLELNLGRDDIVKRELEYWLGG